MRSVMVISALVASAILAGCQASTGLRGQPSGVEGQWVGTDGVAVSSFGGGQFESTATDTGNRLAIGTYRYSDSRNVAITVNSLIRQTTTNVNCTLINPGQLNCTTDSGQQFTLVRRALS